MQKWYEVTATALEEAPDDTSVEHAAGLRFPPQEIEQRLLTIAIQNGVIGPEICSMLGGIPAEID